MLKVKQAKTCTFSDANAKCQCSLIIDLSFSRNRRATEESSIINNQSCSETHNRTRNLHIKGAASTLMLTLTQNKMAANHMSGGRRDGVFTS